MVVEDEEQTNVVDVEHSDQNVEEATENLVQAQIYQKTSSKIAKPCIIGMVVTVLVIVVIVWLTKK